MEYYPLDTAEYATLFVLFLGYEIIPAITKVVVDPILAASSY